MGPYTHSPWIILQLYPVFDRHHVPSGYGTSQFSHMLHEEYHQPRTTMEGFEDLSRCRSSGEGKSKRGRFEDKTVIATRTRPLRTLQYLHSHKLSYMFLYGRDSSFNSSARKFRLDNINTTGIIDAAYCSRIAQV